MSERGIRRLTRRMFAARFRQAMAAHFDGHREALLAAEEWSWRNGLMRYERGYTAGYKRKTSLQVPRATKGELRSCAAPDVHQKSGA